jgi:hypothetical protein
MTASDPPRPNDPNECLIPDTVSPEALGKYLLKRSPFDGAGEISEYVQGQSPKESVTYLEKVSSERILGRDYTTWDVHTTGERYWVITNPTNRYSQRLFPSADYTLSFHVGLMSRVLSRRQPQADDEAQDRLAAAWRRWIQAAEALDQANEAEEFQAVGMRCRECLLALARDIADESMVPKGAIPPKASDFIDWSALIANAIASGSSAREVRSYLKTSAKAAWQLVAWLTHASTAVRFDADLAVDATHTALASFGIALMRFEHGIPSQCPECLSYQVSTVYVGEVSEGMTYAPVCHACGWSSVPVDDAKPGSDSGAPSV